MQCLTNVQLLVVTKKDFKGLLESYPYIRECIVSNLVATRGEILKDFAGIPATTTDLDAVFMKDRPMFRHASIINAKSKKGSASTRLSSDSVAEGAEETEEEKKK